MCLFVLRCAIVDASNSSVSYVAFFVCVVAIIWFMIFVRFFLQIFAVVFLMFFVLLRVTRFLLSLCFGAVCEGLNMTPSSRKFGDTILVLFSDRLCLKTWFC